MYYNYLINTITLNDKQYKTMSNTLINTENKIY